MLTLYNVSVAVRRRRRKIFLVRAETGRDSFNVLANDEESVRRFVQRQYKCEAEDILVEDRALVHYVLEMGQTANQRLDGDILILDMPINCERRPSSVQESQNGKRGGAMTVVQDADSIPTLKR